jgi:hypothetical protein
MPPSPDPTYAQPKHRETDEWGNKEPADEPGMELFNRQKDISGDTIMLLTAAEVDQARRLGISLVNFARIKSGVPQEESSPPKSYTDTIQEMIRSMPHKDIEQLAREVLGRAPQYEVKKLAGRLRLWSLKT